jgi:3-methyladenine DNA glycosylase/8-oxoguanine DNA glycosylase
MRPAELALDLVEQLFVQSSAAMRLYGLERLPTKQELVDIAERWKPYRSLAVGYLFLSEFEAKP